MKKSILFLFTLLPIWLLAQSDSKLEGLLKQTGYEFKKASQDVWITTVEGKNKKAIDMVVVESGGMTVLFSIVKENAIDSLSAVQLKNLLKLNMALDRIKIGFDEENNLLVRIDATTRLLDAEELTLLLDQAGSAADESFAIVQQI